MSILASRDSGPPAVHAREAAMVLAELGSREEGLSDLEAGERLLRFGTNTLRTAKPAPAWRIVLAQLRSVVVLLLLAAAGVSLLTGDPLDAVAIGGVLLINVVLGSVTEIRARRAMEALRRFDAPRALVVREGRAREIPAAEVVPGDVIEVEGGRAVPADARILRATELRVIEAPLTGESLPVSKAEHAVAPDAPLPERVDMLYKGTTVAAGTGEAVVVATGMATELGRIGGLVGAIREERTPLERRLDQLGARLAALALLAGAAVAAVGLLHGAEPGEMLKAGIALAIAAVPEGLPAVATIALAMGGRRMARRNALVRRLPSVETLGSVTVVCTDKTGTLTAGETTATTLWLPGRTVEVTGLGYAPHGALLENGALVRGSDDPRIELALRIGLLANRAEVEETPSGWIALGDPTEAALVTMAAKVGVRREALLEELPEVAELPFSSERMLMATFHRSAGRVLVTHVKGAPERVLAACDSVATVSGARPLDRAERARILDRNREMASRGLRVLALAYGAVAEPAEEALRELTFVGLVGMIDPPAAGVKETIRELREAGIRTVMITGDQQLTAAAIARELGILGPEEETLDGRELACLDEPALAQRIDRVGAFSRVSPEDKLKIVAAFRDRGEIVGMLGDGVNDAAALRRADVGVAMGIRGTDVAKEVAVVVLQDDSFRTVAAAVEEGRAIFDNIRKFVFYLFSCNLAEIFVLLGATLVGLPLPLLPLQILWMNLVFTFPALALALEPAEPDVMRRPPRDPREAILSRRFFAAISLYAALITVVSLAAFGYGIGTDADAITLCFTTIALAQTLHLGNARSQGPVLAPHRAVANLHALGAALLVVALQLLAVYWAPLATLLGTTPLAARDWLVVVPLAAFPALVGQAIKLLGRAHGREHRSQPREVPQHHD